MEAIGSYDELCRIGLDFTNTLKEGDDSKYADSLAKKGGPGFESPSNLSKERRPLSVISSATPNEV